MARGMVNGHLNPRYHSDSYPRDAANRADKGMEGGSCNRTACQLEHSAFCYNTVMRAYYCIRCARAINEGVAEPFIIIPPDYHEKWEAAVIAADEKETAKGVDK